MNYLEFRNIAAKQGTELTPTEAKEMMDAYDILKNSVNKVYQDKPYFYMHLKNLTTEQKFEKIEELKECGIEMDIREFNETTKTILNLCEAEGYV
jgi:hypothetical protein